MLHTTISPVALGAALLLSPQDPAPAPAPAQDDAAQDVVEGPPECTADEVTLESGVRYCVLEAGSGGETPMKGDLVEVDYTGWLTDGTRFDTSREPRSPGLEARPAVFPVGGLIEGWNEALALMSPGDHWRVFVPAALAYGQQGSPPKIGPNQDLIFEVELQSIVQRVPRLTEWEPEAEGVVTMESGLAYRVLAAGEGPSIEESGQGNVGFSLYNQEGDLVTAHTLNRMNDGASIQTGQYILPFFEDVAPLLREGAEIQCKVPSKLGAGARGGGPGLTEGEDEIWMLRGMAVRPMFRMPAAEELTTTESGLQYVMLTEGDGAEIAASNTVVVDYVGWFTDGESFDDSFSRGQPASFGVGQVIPGWTEGLQLMKGGGEAIFVIPAELGYGSSPPPGFRKDADLVFYVKVRDVL